MREPVDLSVAIPAFNEAGRLPATLRDLRAFLDLDGRRTEVIVVDDGSTDEPAKQSGEPRPRTPASVSFDCLRTAANVSPSAPEL